MRKAFLLILLFNGMSYALGQTDSYQKGSFGTFKRLYKINDSVYRSEQPNRKGFRKLEASGIKTIINLRRLKEDTKKARDTRLKLIHLPLKAGELSEDDLLETLRIIQSSEKPLLIHCWHGSDRTGAVVAAYRMLIENWEKQKAIEEFLKPEFGYHKNRYPNLEKLLLDLDLEKLRQELH